MKSSALKNRLYRLPDAENIPGIATGMTTRIAVCQRVAPQPREADLSVCGTALKASSAIV